MREPSGAIARSRPIPLKVIAVVADVGIARRATRGAVGRVANQTTKPATAAATMETTAANTTYRRMVDGVSESAELGTFPKFAFSSMTNNTVEMSEILRLRSFSRHRRVSERIAPGTLSGNRFKSG